MDVDSEQSLNSSAPAGSSWLERQFALAAQRTTVRREVAAGFATFMTMAYIIFVNPIILSSAGMPFPAVVAATCIGAAIPTLLMGLWANYPFALASGMGLNAMLAVQATQPGMNWRTLMGVIMVEGIIITLLVLSGAREKVMEVIPVNLKRAIGVGIGVFIAFLGLQQMGWVTKGPGGAFLTHGSLIIKPTVVATLGVLLLMVLMAYRVTGAILFGIIGTAALAWGADLVAPGTKALMTTPKQFFSTPDFSVFAQADLVGALKPGLIAVIFAFLITDFFDTMGTVIGVAGQAGFLNEKHQLPRLNRVLMVDSLAAIWGGFCGASSVTSYIESAAGVSAGGRTGLVSVVVALLFLVSLFISPIVGAVPAVATAPALLLVGFMMISVVKHMDFDSVEEGIPAFLTMLLIPLGESISFGIGMGMIAYVLINVFRGKGRTMSLWLYAMATLFAASFIWGM